jgi:hypothetical protein
MKKALGVLLVGCLLAALSFTFAACDGGGDGGATAAGQLPDFEVGDVWTWSYAMQGQSYTLTEECIGEEMVEGRDCWVTNMAFDPLLTFPQAEGVSTVTEMTYWGDKATCFNEVKSEMVGHYDDTDFTLTVISSYSSWASLFPLKVGNEVETEHTLTQYYNGSQAGEPLVSTLSYRVDGQETITVSAGTFSCWRLILSVVVGGGQERG